jgi:hypothetical protein
MAMDIWLIQVQEIRGGTFQSDGAFDDAHTSWMNCSCSSVVMISCRFPTSEKTISPFPGWTKLVLLPPIHFSRICESSNRHGRP